MKKLFLLSLFSIISTFTVAGESEDIFAALSAYDLTSAQAAFDNWVPVAAEDQLIKNTAAAYMQLLRGDMQGATTQLAEIASRIEEIGNLNPKVAIYADRTVGLKHFLEGDFEKAYQYYWPALLLSRETYSANSIISIDQLQLVVELFEAQGKWVVAEEMLIATLGHCKKVYGKKHPKTIETMAHLGYLNTVMAKFDVAQGYFDEANKLLESGNIRYTMTNAWSLIYQSNFYLTKGNFTVAESLNKQALKILDQEIDSYHPANVFAYSIEARVYVAMNDLREAGVKLAELISYQKKHLGESHPFIATSLLMLADLLIMSDNMNESLPVLEASEKIIWETLKEEHVSYSNLLILKAKSVADSDNNQAEKYFKEAIATVEKRYGKNHHYLARAQSAYAAFLYENNQLKDALAAEKRALEIRTSLFDFYHPDYTASIFSLAKIQLKAKNINEAGNYLKKGAENYVIQYNKYFSFLSEYEKGQFYARTNEFFDLYYHFALFESPKDQRQYWINDALNYRLLTKALLFQSVKDLKEAVYKLNDPQLNEAYAIWIKTKESLSKLNKFDQRFTSQGSLQKDSLVELANELEKKISLKVAISKNAQKESSQLTWQALASKLADDEMAIEMIRLRDFDLERGSFSDSIRYVALALNNRMTSGPREVLLMNGNELEDKFLAAYRKMIKFKLTDKRSYGIYIQPILEQLGGQMREEVYFSPDGVYNQINLNTLYDTESEKYFIDEYHVHILSSLRDLIDEKELNPQASNSKSAFIFYGYPVYEHHPIKGSSEKPKVLSTGGGGSQERGSHFEIKNMISRGAEIIMLPGTLEEVNAASDIVDDYVDHEVITGVEATEESIKKLESPGLLHIATHGFFLSGSEIESKPVISEDYSEIVISNASINPLFNSGLMLTGAAHAYDSLVITKEFNAIQEGNSYEDGIMTSYEAMNIDLQSTRLVILSACETGLGKVKSGEGVYGLQRAFQTAGAESVVISLWKVSDEATKELMTLFYKNYVSGMDARTAFTKAQQDMRSTFKDPYYWGAFVFVGMPSETGVPLVN